MAASKKDIAAAADVALDILWKRCYESHRKCGTKGIVELSFATDTERLKQPVADRKWTSTELRELRDMVGVERLLAYVAEAWKVLRVRLDSPPDSKLPKDTDAACVWDSLQLAWPVYVDAKAQESFTSTSPDIAFNSLVRLLRHAAGFKQGAELLAAEGDYTRIFETQCQGDFCLLWGPCLIRDRDAKAGSSVSAGRGSERRRLIEVLRVFALVPFGMREHALKEIATFLAAQPDAQLPWHVFGPPLNLQTDIDSVGDDLRLLRSKSGYVELDVNFKSLTGSRAMSNVASDDGEIRRLADTADMRRFLDIVGGERLTDEEKVAGSACRNSLLVGRSGTGKTTVAMLRLAALELLRAPTQVPPQAVFLTASPVLSREVLRSFKTLRHYPGLRSQLFRAGLLKASAASRGGRRTKPRLVVSDSCQNGVDSVDVKSASLHGTIQVSSSSHSEPCQKDVTRLETDESSMHAGSLGSWLALEPCPTEDSFEMVEGEVYEICTIPTEDDPDLMTQIDEQLDDDLAKGSVTAPLDIIHKAESDNGQDGSDSDEDGSEHGGWAPLPGPRLPPALNMADADDFPMFLTVRHLLHMVDAGLEQPFFARGDDHKPLDADICTWQPEGGGTHLVNVWIGGAKWQPGIGDDTVQGVDADADDLLHVAKSSGTAKKSSATGSQRASSQRRMEIGYEYFAEVMWPVMGKSMKDIEADGFHPSLVWTEIMAHIKGSQEALASGHALSFHQYVGEFGRKRTPMTKEQRAKIHGFWSSYENMKRDLSAFDEADFVCHVHKHLRAEGYAGPKIRCLVVDEVQDISQATLRLILQLVEPQVGGLFLCGDPAQTISKGLAFRLCDLRSAFVEGQSIARHEAPDVLRLTTNFRSTANVLRLGNDVLSILRAYFPNSLDHGGQETAADKADGPQPLQAASLEDLLLDVTSGQPNSKVAFGADLVVLVREQSRKADMPELLQHCLAMTVWEAKGLEFDTVVIFNFFKDAQGDWSVLDGDHTAPPTDFKVESNALLCCELKQLYVAVTRAKRRILFYDEDQHVGCRLLWSQELVGDLKTGVTDLAQTEQNSTTNTPEAWRSQGRRLLRLGFAVQAELCFSRSGDDMLRCEAEATKIAKSAAARKARSTVALVQNSTIPENTKVFEIASEENREPTSIIDEFLQAAALFDACSKPAHAGKCYAAAGDWAQAADRFCAAEHWNAAAVALLRTGSTADAARCFEKAGQWLRALKAWETAEQPTELMQAAQKALEGSAFQREQILVFVRKALEALPDIETIREAAVLLGAPSGGNDTIIDFVANDLGAELAALRLESMQGEKKNGSNLAFRAFHRSVLRKEPLWSIFSQAPGGSSRVKLLAVLYGLELPKEFLNENDAKAGCTVQLGSGLTCTLIRKGSISGLRQSLSLAESWEVVLTADVRLAERVKQAEASLKHNRGTGSAAVAGETMRATQDLHFLPKATLCSLASKFAKNIWNLRGPLGPSEIVPPRIASSLIVASQSNTSAVEYVFALLCAGGESTSHIFLEMESMRPHAAFASFASSLRAGAICTAAASLLHYLESSASDGISSNFVYTLVSYLVGPATVLLQPCDGAHVLSCLLWEWPSELRGTGLKDILSELDSHLRTLQDELGKSGSGWAAAGWAGDISLPEATEAQLAYCLGYNIDAEWWELSWSDAFPPVRGGSTAAIEKQRGQEFMKARLASGRKITAWTKRMLPRLRLARQRKERWPPVCEAANVLRSLSHVPTTVAAKLLLETERFVRGGTSALVVRDLAKEVAGKEAEMHRRTEGLKVREEAERTREVRVQKKEEKRRRGEERQRRLEEKAAVLKFIARSGRR